MRKIFAAGGLSILLLQLIFLPVQAVFYPPLPNPDLDPFIDAPGSGNQHGDVLNPLTGLPVQDPASQYQPAALVSITNWPVSARPQAGLSYAAMVFEFSIGDGETRFLSVFYGDLPPEEQTDANGTIDTAIGPLRSGRLFYESLRKSYHGNLFMASAFKGVRDNLSQYHIFYGSDTDIISAFVEVKEIKKIVEQSGIKVNPQNLAVNQFVEKPPAGGAYGSDLWLIYNAFDQIHWQYDPQRESYIRYQDLADGETFVAASDRINQQRLEFENLIILYVNHRYCTQYAYDVDFLYQDLQPAVLFRDGRVYEIYWTTRNEEYERTTGTIRPIRFVYRDGSPFPMKPGQTWVHIVPLETPLWEAPMAEDLFSLLNKKKPESGNWVARFYSSQMVYDESVCKLIGYQTQ